MTEQGWGFEARIAAPDGIEVTVFISVPVTAAWTASGERVATISALPSIVKMCAVEALKQITEAKNEVPF